MTGRCSSRIRTRHVDLKAAVAGLLRRLRKKGVLSRQSHLWPAIAVPGNRHSDRRRRNRRELDRSLN